MLLIKDLQPGDVFSCENDVFIRTDGVLHNDYSFSFEWSESDETKKDPRILCFDVKMNTLTSLNPELQVRKLKYQLDVT